MLKKCLTSPGALWTPWKAFDRALGRGNPGFRKVGILSWSGPKTFRKHVGVIWSSNLEFVSGWSPDVDLCWVNLSTLLCRPLALYSDSRIPLPTSHMHRSHLSVVSLEPHVPTCLRRVGIRNSHHLSFHLIQVCRCSDTLHEKEQPWHVIEPPCRIVGEYCWSQLP